MDKRKIYLIVLVIFILTSILIAEEESEFELPGIKYVRYWSGSDNFPKNSLEIESKGLGIFNIPNLKKYTDLAKWLNEVNFKIDDQQEMDKLLKKTKDLISKAWEDAINGLLNCDEFRHFITKDGKSPYENLRNFLNNDEAKLFFSDPNPNIPGGDEGSADREKKTIRLKMFFLETIFKFCAEKIKSNNPDISDYKTNEELHKMFSFMGHEMLHLFADLDMKYIENKKEHCEIYCLQKSCLGYHNIIPSYCETECKPGYCQGDRFEPCPPPCGGNGSGSHSGGDYPDDNYSFYSPGNEWGDAGNCPPEPAQAGDEGAYEYAVSYYPDILVYGKNSLNLIGLLDKYLKKEFIEDYENSDFSLDHKVLVIPNGGFIGDCDSEIIREALKRYVAAGNTLLVLGQQFGEDYEKLVPVPTGEHIKAYGWREDQSCWNGSSYFKTMHPVLSAQRNELVQGGVDGSFSIYPADATVLLRRSRDNEAILLYYPYGSGKVILTSFFTEYGFAHNQASSNELQLIRDLLTFAKNPNLPIPIYDLSQDATPAIDLNVMVKNDSEKTAAKAKLKIWAPDRNYVLFEKEQAISLAPGQETGIPVSFEYTEGIRIMITSVA